MICTHDLIVDFGKHRGERWTRLPLSYLKWLANEAQGDKKDLALAELSRRGTAMPTDLELSGHAIDRASLNCRRIWHEHKQDGEGLYSWLLRVASEVMVPGQEECFGYGMKFCFSFGEFYPVLKTVMPHKVKEDSD